MVKATLILVPSQLMSQWPKEIKKFTNNAFQVVVIKTIADLNKTSVKDIENADIVVSTNNLFHSDKYFPRLARLAGGRPFPASSTKGGRLFQQLYSGLWPHQLAFFTFCLFCASLTCSIDL